MARKSDVAPIIKLVVEAGRPDQKMLRRIEIAAQIMVRKSWERGQAWKRTGMYGAFIEIYSAYMRLVKLMEHVRGRDRLYDFFKEDPYREKFREEVDNVCNDIRNFTTLLQLAMDNNKVDSNYVPPKPKGLKK